MPRRRGWPAEDLRESCYGIREILPAYHLRNRYVVTSDGKRFLVIMPVEEKESAPTFRVVLNWPALLKR
jgi:hypothetical protein